MNGKIIFIIATLLLLGLSSCDKRNQRSLSYLETQCADPWGVASSRSEKEALIKNYFAEKGVIIISVEFAVATNVLTCQACGCNSGRKIIASIDKSDVETLKAHGFFEEEQD
jgi:hypothetical protein